MAAISRNIRIARWFPVPVGVNGTNWQDRCQYSLTWHNPNPLRVAGDAKALHEAGMVLVRTHYFMPGWFRVMPGEIFAETHGDFYRSFEKGPEFLNATFAPSRPMWRCSLIWI